MSPLLRAALPQFERTARAWLEAASDAQLEDLVSRLSQWPSGQLRLLECLFERSAYFAELREEG